MRSPRIAWIVYSYNTTRGKEGGKKRRGGKGKATVTDISCSRANETLEHRPANKKSIGAKGEGRKRGRRENKEIGPFTKTPNLPLYVSSTSYNLPSLPGRR